MRPQRILLRWVVAISVAITIHVMLLVGYAGFGLHGAAGEGEGGIEIGLGLLGEMGESLESSDARDASEQPREESPEPPPPEPSDPEPASAQPEPVQQVTEVKVQAETAEETSEPPRTEPAAEPEAQPSTLAPSEGGNAGEDAVTQRRQSSGTGNSQRAGGSKGTQAAYQAMLAAQLNRYKHYPMAARRGREEGTTTLSLLILHDGTLADFHISESSGSESLDAAVLRMLERAQPFPAFPDSMTEEEVRVSLRVPFSLNPL